MPEENEVPPSGGPVPPYTSFRTFLNLLERLEEQKAVPARIDRGFLAGQSEGAKTQLLAALKFLGLINETGDVMPLLNELAMQPTQRPDLLRRVLERVYPSQNRLGNVNATQSQLEETFAPVTGATRRKAIAFYLHAAAYARLPVSKFFKAPRIGRPAGVPSAPRRRKPRAAPSIRATNGSNGEHNGTTLPELQVQYINMLMDMAKKSDVPNRELLDRIQGLLGFNPPESSENGTGGLRVSPTTEL